MKKEGSGLQRPSTGPSRHVPHEDQNNMTTAAAMTPVVSGHSSAPGANKLQSKASVAALTQRVWDFFLRKIIILVIVIIIIPSSTGVVAKIQPEGV